MVNEGRILPGEASMPQHSFIDSFKNALQPETIAHKLGIDKNTVIDVGLYSSIGFIIGFLLKKYSEYFIACAFFVVGIVVLQHFGYISVDINMAKICEMIGVQSVPSINEGYSLLVLAWMKSHVPATASLFLGFLVGLKCA